MSDISNFFLKDGYIENVNTSSLDTDSKAQHEFWTTERLTAANYYQFHVYSFAARFARRKSLTIISDVGCGPAVKTAHFFSGQEYKVYLYDQESCRSICATQMPTADFYSVNLESATIITQTQKCDLVICSDVLEHLANPGECIELCKRLVSTNGYIIFSTPERDQLRGMDCMASGHPQHIREWNRREFIQLLKHFELTIIQSKLLPQHALGVFERMRYRITGGWHKPRKYRSCHLTLCSPQQVNS
jgi:2-polyprenyl-3-methyl-5-hydroxy-6-metoxy-1,4-benzoquinol methylase